MIKAVYKQRGDGDYDFVAAFETDLLPDFPSDWTQEIFDWLAGEDEMPLLIEVKALDQLPDVWEGKP